MIPSRSTYLAGEIATTMAGLSIAVPEQEWALLEPDRLERFAACRLDLAGHAWICASSAKRRSTRGSLQSCALAINVNPMSERPSCLPNPGGGRWRDTAKSWGRDPSGKLAVLTDLIP